MSDAQPLTDKQITAERLARFRDYEQFCPAALTVKNNKGKLVSMETYPAQKKLNALIESIRAKRKPVRIVALKARRVMVSTATAAKFFHEVPHTPGQEALVVAHTADATLNLFEMYQRFQETYRDFEGHIKLPELDGPITQKRIKWVNGARIQCKTAGSKNFGRSFNFRRLHLSEAAFFADQATFLTGLIQTVPDDPDTVIVVESTANGIGDEFYKLCMQAMEGNSEWVLFFFAWWEHPDYARPLECSAGEFQHSLNPEELELMKLYRLSFEQLNWRRWCIKNNCRNSLSVFKQEYPSNPSEAFLGTGRPRFDHASVDRMPTIEGLRGRLQEDDYAGQKLLRFLPMEHGELTIFRKPEPNKMYMAGADVCEGTDALEGEGEADSDYSVLYLSDRATGEQVAQWRCQDVHPAEFAANAWLVLRWYNWAQLVPEANGPGLAFIEKLISLGYPPSLIYHRNEAPDGDPRKLAPMVGFKTTMVTRPQLISTLDDCLRQGAITVYDAIAKQEMRTFVIKKNGRAEHQYGCHDDCVFAIALNCEGLAGMAMPTNKAPRAFNDRPTNYLKRRQEAPPDRVRIQGERIFR